MRTSDGRGWRLLFILAGLTCLPFNAAGGEREASLPVISIVIDDLGKQLEPGRRVLALPGPVAAAFLQRAPHTRQLATEAYQGGKEVMLHLPMDSVDGRRLDPGAVTLDMSEQQFVSTVQANLASVPYVSGINNHMGSLLTRHPGHMLWLMRTMQQHGQLFFVDSRTTVATVARRVAWENGVPAGERNVFLDNQPDPESIAYQFRRLLQLARRQGAAVAIGHPHPQTLSMLEQQIPRLEQQGIRLLPVHRVIELQQEGEQTWQASLSHSHKGAKN